MKQFDAVVIAIGSSPLLPPIPGLEHALPAMKAYEPNVDVGERVVILGGGLVGCETAVHLAKQGKHVTIVEMRQELAPDAYRLHKHKLRQLIASDERIDVLLGARCLSAGQGSVTIEQDQAERSLTADTAVAALGMRANDTTELEQLAEEANVRAFVIGDCKRARKIYDAIEEGFLTAMAL
jgi:2-enoate reductase